MKVFIGRSNDFWREKLVIVTANSVEEAQNALEEHQDKLAIQNIKLEQQKAEYDVKYAHTFDVEKAYHNWELETMQEAEEYKQYLIKSNEENLREVYSKEFINHAYDRERRSVQLFEISREHPEVIVYEDIEYD